MNHRMAETYGATPEDLIGKYVGELLNNKEHVRFYHQSMETQQEVSYETHDPASDRWYAVHIYPTLDGVTAYSRDVSERKAAELQITQMNAELERRVAERTVQLDRVNHELESFAYSVSHDLRAPLRAIDGFSAALEEDIGDTLDERSRGYLTRVRNAAARMATLIDSMLGLAKLARQELVYEPVDISQLARSIAGELQAHDPERVVTFDIADGLETSAEPMLMRAILENLMGNAWKFTRKTPGATIAVGRIAESGEFFVRDNGAGFDEAYAKKLFGAFQRLHAQDDFEGTGIGLATVARVVHRYGGDVRAEGAVDKGATFYFTIPARS
jgi:light-regulated signal transduction histidine kinase (bacteriophytochrome)